MKVVAFAASSSSTSINKQLVTYATSLLTDAEVEVLDLNDFDLPSFSEDKEKELEKPEAAQAFHAKLGAADAIVISYAEHNGSYTAAYKNLFDWTSRIDMKVFQHKPAVYLSTSPGPGGAKTVLGAAVASALHFAADLKGFLSVPSFYSNFDQEKGTITNTDINDALKNVMTTLN